MLFTYQSSSHFHHFKLINHVSDTSDTQIMLLLWCYICLLTLSYSHSFFTSPIPLVHCCTVIWTDGLLPHSIPFNTLKYLFSDYSRTMFYMYNFCTSTVAS